MQSANLYSLLDKKPKTKAEKDASKLKKKAAAAEEKSEKKAKASTAELEKAIFAQPLSSSNWADTDDDEEDAFEMEGGRAVEDDGWSRVPVSWRSDRRYRLPVAYAFCYTGTSPAPDGSTRHRGARGGRGGERAGRGGEDDRPILAE